MSTSASPWERLIRRNAGDITWTVVLASFLNFTSRRAFTKARACHLGRIGARSKKKIHQQLDTAFTSEFINEIRQSACRANGVKSCAIWKRLHIVDWAAAKADPELTDAYQTVAFSTAPLTMTKQFAARLPLREKIVPRNLAAHGDQCNGCRHPDRYPFNRLCTTLKNANEGSKDRRDLLRDMQGHSPASASSLRGIAQVALLAGWLTPQRFNSLMEEVDYREGVAYAADGWLKRTNHWLRRRENKHRSVFSQLRRVVFGIRTMSGFDTKDLAEFVIGREVKRERAISAAATAIKRKIEDNNYALKNERESDAMKMDLIKKYYALKANANAHERHQPATDESMQ